jgi:hypothetical protein
MKVEVESVVQNPSRFECFKSMLDQ